MSRTLRFLSNYFFLSAILVLSSYGTFARTSLPQLSEVAEISIITSTSGTDLYTAFGHSAIRITDPILNYDMVFNYGTFNFSQKGFYVNFVRGRLNYYLSVAPYVYFERSYIRENRSLEEQVIRLSFLQKQKLFEFLIHNASPENKYYLYDFFFDNCATRIRDVFEEVLKDSIRFNYNYTNKEHSFRQLLHPYIVDRPWADLGIELILGLPADQIASPRDYMFLPDYIYLAFHDADVFENGEWIPMVVQRNVLFNASEESVSKPIINPGFIFWLLFFVICALSLLAAYLKKHWYWIDTIIFGITGFLGILFLLFWFATDHKALPMNMNLLWAIPLHFPVAFTLLKKKHPKFLKYYFLVIGFLMLFLVLGWNILPQHLHAAFIPIALILGMRSFMYYFSKSKSLQTA